MRTTQTAEVVKRSTKHINAYYRFQQHEQEVVQIIFAKSRTNGHNLTRYCCPLPPMIAEPNKSKCQWAFPGMKGVVTSAMAPEGN